MLRRLKIWSIRSRSLRAKYPLVGRSTCNIDFSKVREITILSLLVLRRHCMLTLLNSEWIVDFGCTHCMAKDASLFSSLSRATKEEIFVADDYALTVASCSRIEC